MKKQYHAIGASLMSLALASTHGMAAEITWSTSVITSSADTDVSTNGELRFAINAASGTTVTANGVDFQGITAPGLASTVIPQNGGNESMTTDITGNANVFNFGSIDAGDPLAQMLPSAFWGGSSPVATTLSGLVPGQEYEIQVFTNGRNSRDDQWASLFDNGLPTDDPGYVAIAGISKLNNIDKTDPENPVGVGQGDYIIGTFTADGTTQVFRMQGSTDGGVSGNSANRIHINAIQLRAIGTILPIPDNDPNLWTGDLDANLDNTTNNFALNNFDAASQVGNLVDVVADDGIAVFSDEYFVLDSPISVTNFDLMIPTDAAPQATVLDFESTYSVTSVDTMGIVGDTSVRVSDSDLANPDNGGDLTLLGTHTYTGSTEVSPDSSLALGNGTTSTVLASGTLLASGEVTWDTTVEDVTFDGNISGPGSLEKLGPNTLTLTGSGSGFPGATIVSAGSVVATGQYADSAIQIAAGAVFEHNMLVNNTPTGSYSGDGILRIGQNDGNNTSLQFRSTMTLGPDATIEILSGLHRGSGNFRANWTNNQSNLFIASGATLLGNEASFRFNVITGGGVFQTGWNDGRHTGTTIGLGNGSGTFDGDVRDTNRSDSHNGMIRKVGTGTQVFAGLNSYSGDTIVEDGTLEFPDGSSIAFYPEANMVSNQARGEGAGTGTLIVDGFLDIDTGISDPLTGNTDLTLGNYWILFDTTNLNVVFGDNLLVSDVSDGMNVVDYTESTPGVWTYTDGNGVKFSFEEASGTLFIGDPFDTNAAPVKIDSVAFNGANLEVSASNLVSSKTYQMRRSPDLTSPFDTDVDSPFTGGTTNTFTDTAPPAGRAFYQLFEVTP